MNLVISFIKPQLVNARSTAGLYCSSIYWEKNSYEATIRLEKYPEKCHIFRWKKQFLANIVPLLVQTTDRDCRRTHFRSGCRLRCNLPIWTVPCGLRPCCTVPSCHGHCPLSYRRCSTR